MGMVCKCEMCGKIFQPGVYNDYGTPSKYARLTLRLLVDIEYQHPFDGVSSAEVIEIDGVCPECLDKLDAVLHIKKHLEEIAPKLYSDEEGETNGGGDTM